MKKIRALVIALLCLTIGGVYAAWEFAEDNNIDRKAQTVTVTLATKVETSEVLGSFEIALSDDFAIVIDQKAEGDHTTNLLVEGYITLTFTANENASKDIRDNGVESNFYFAVSDSLKYNDANSDTAGERAIYSIDTQTKHVIGEVDSAEAKKWTKTGDRTFTYTIQNQELQSLITMNDFVIDSSTEYAAFNEVLRSGTITLYLNDTATPNA
ncbi:MAG: hypothetical protein IJB32_00250 [Clostridia bacterium]|nr:hypothetical protein [Clostridia bacterium]